MPIDSRAKALLVLLVYGAAFWACIYGVLRVTWNPDLPMVAP